LHGKHQTWWNSGEKLKECIYDNDKLNGKYKTWHRNGINELDFTFKNDNRDGEYRHWHNNGKKIKWMYYINGYCRWDILTMTTAWYIFYRLISKRKNKQRKKTIEKIRPHISNIEGERGIYFLIMEYLSKEEQSSIIKTLL
jgi:hypothetical protein